MEHILSRVHSCVSDNMNQSLMATYKEDEIIEELTGIGPTKASGVDGFSAIFLPKVLAYFW